MFNLEKIPKIEADLKESRSDIEKLQKETGQKLDKLFKSIDGIYDLLGQLCDELGLVKDEELQAAEEEQQDWVRIKVYGKETNYEVSKSGVIRNFKTKRRKTYKKINQRYYVQLSDKGKNIQLSVPRVVLEAFGAIPYDVVDYVVMFKNGDNSDFRLENLLWQRAKEEDFKSRTHPLALKSLAHRYPVEKGATI